MLSDRPRPAVDLRRHTVTPFLLPHNPAYISYILRFGENSAFARDFVKRMSLVAHSGELLERYFKLARGSLDEGAGPARAGALHQDLLAPGFAAAGEEDGFHVFAADFAHE